MPVAALVLHLLCGNTADLVAPEMIVSAFRQNFVKVSPDALMNGESVGLVQHDAGGAERARPLISVPPADQGS